MGSCFAYIQSSPPFFLLFPAPQTTCTSFFHLSRHWCGGIHRWCAAGNPGEEITGNGLDGEDVVLLADVLGSNRKNMK